MKRDSKLSGLLHVLLHMSEATGPITSERLAEMMRTNPVVVRRLLAGPRELGWVTSQRGHDGGWLLTCNLSRLTLADAYRAVGAPPLLALGHRAESPGCLVEQAVNTALGDAFEQAEATLLAALEGVTLASLASDFGRRQRQGRARQPRCG